MVPLLNCLVTIKKFHGDRLRDRLRRAPRARFEFQPFHPRVSNVLPGL